MATKKVAMVAVKKPAKLSLAAGAQQLKEVVKTYAEALSNPLTPERLTEVFDQVRAFQKNMDDLYEAARQKVLALVTEQGDTVTATGSKRLELEGWLLEIRPQKTGYDSKKVLAVLRNKDINPNVYMDTEITYKANPEKMDLLVTEGLLTKNELEACKVDLKYAVQPPKRKTEESDE